MFFCVSVCLSAQTGEATLSGTITDQSGAVIAGAIVSIADASGMTRNVTSNDSGEYVFGGLQPGVYSFSVIASGFVTYRSEGIRVSGSERVTIDAMVTPATASAEVNV